MTRSRLVFALIYSLLLRRSVNSEVIFVSLRLSVTLIAFDSSSPPNSSATTWSRTFSHWPSLCPRRCPSGQWSSLRTRLGTIIKRPKYELLPLYLSALNFWYKNVFIQFFSKYLFYKSYFRRAVISRLLTPEGRSTIGTRSRIKSDGKKINATVSANF